MSGLNDLRCCHAPFIYTCGSAYKYGELLERLMAVRHVFGDAEGLRKALAEDARYDLGMTGGDWWPHFAAFYETGIPYILVEQDVYTLRTGKPSAGEQAMIEYAAGVIFTSDEHRDYCAGRYWLPPHEVIHLRPLREQLDFEPLPKLPGKHLVYAGGLVKWAGREGLYGYRAYHRVFQAFMAAGWTVHVYSAYGRAEGPVSEEYEALGCVVHPRVHHADLPREMSQYTAGLHGYANEGCEPDAFAYCMTCRPNKCWDYLAAGIPTIGYQSGNSGEVFDGRWGTVLHSLDGLDRISLPAIDEQVRQAEVIDEDLPRFEAFLSRALGVR